MSNANAITTIIGHPKNEYRPIIAGITVAANSGNNKPKINGSLGRTSGRRS